MIMPAPLDLIIGLFHPWRDFFGNLPFKNFIVSDPVRQQIPWRFEVIDQIKNGILPLWNPYNFSGTPLLANIQSAVFYPLNTLFFLFSFPVAWSIYIYSAWILGFLFMFIYLRNLKLAKAAAFFGSFCFVLSGFYVAWLENGVLTHTLLWLPLILWSIDRKKSLIFLFSLLISFYAGHWQTFFYVFIFAHVYLLLKKRFYFLLSTFFFLFLSLPQLLPSLQFISLSARSTDQLWQANPGWFIPWENLIQFVSPDFFGNPSTLNYRGVFSYQEFIGYIGIPGLLFAISAVFIKRKIIWFFAGAAVLCLLFALPTPVAKLPFILNFPLISSSMPTRLLSIIGFSLAVLTAFGFQKLNKKITALFIGLLVALWLAGPSKYLIIPTGLFLATLLFKNSPKILILILIADLGFFAYKFLPFSNTKYFYSDTKITRFLQENTKDYSRLMALNDEIFPPNFNIMYKLQSVSGYDPLYLKSYADLVGGGNRIIVPKDYKSPVINALGVKYILAFDDLPGYPLVMQEGKTKVYENPFAMPRVFLVSSAVYSKNDEDALSLMKSVDLRNTVVVNDPAIYNSRFTLDSFATGSAKILNYSENRVVVEAENNGNMILIFTDNYYPGWKAIINGVNYYKIWQVDCSLRGIYLPAGKRIIEFKYELF